MSQTPLGTGDGLQAGASSAVGESAEVDLAAVVTTMAVGLVRPDRTARERAARAVAADARAARLGRLGQLGAWLAATRGAFPAPPLARVRALVFTDAQARGGARRLDVRGTPPGQALRAGAEAVDAAIEEGTDLLVVAGTTDAAETAALVLVAALTERDVVETLGLGPASGLDDQKWIQVAAAVRDGLRPARAMVRAGEPLRLLVGAADPHLGALAGALLRAAARRVPVVFDGLPAAAAALLAHRVLPAAASWWLPADRQPQPAHVAALTAIGLEPVLDLGTSAGDGTAGTIALGVLAAAGTLLAELDTDPGQAGSGGHR